MCFTFLKAKDTTSARRCARTTWSRPEALLDGPKTIHLPYDITAMGPDGRLFESEAGGDVQIGVEIPDG